MESPFPSFSENQLRKGVRCEQNTHGAQGVPPACAGQEVCNLLQLRRCRRDSRRPADPKSACKCLDLNVGQVELPGPGDGQIGTASAPNAGIRGEISHELSFECSSS